MGKTSREVYLLMDRAYEGDATRKLALELGYIPVVPPKSNRKNPWEYDRILYKQRNQVVRCFRRIKRYRRVFTRYDKLDIMFLSFIFLALIMDALPLCQHALAVIKLRPHPNPRARLSAATRRFC
jgi:transposase